jgi:hypothetical protein
LCVSRNVFEHGREKIRGLRERSLPVPYEPNQSLASVVLLGEAETRRSNLGLELYVYVDERTDMRCGASISVPRRCSSKAV